MRHPLLLVVSVCLGCSSEAAPTGSDPVAPPTLSADLTLLVFANGGAERLVMGAVATGGTPSQKCTVEKVGGCSLSVCEKVAGTPATPVDPGRLTASSPSIGDAVEIPVTSGYARLIQAGDFKSGEVVRLIGAGSAVVAPFDLSVVVPSPVQFTSLGGCPSGAKDKCTLSESPPIARWTGGTGTLSVLLQPTLDTPTFTQLTCAYAASAGTGRLPPEAIARLPKGSYRARPTVFETPVVVAGGAGLKTGVVSQRTLTSILVDLP